ATITAVSNSQAQRTHVEDEARLRGLSNLRVVAADMNVFAPEGRFDRIVSIEMFEAVGERYWPLYFEKLRSSLVKGGVAVLQIITIAPSRFDAYRACPDFIQRHIFPGGMLPTAEIVEEHAANAMLTVTDRESFGLSYARTLRDWRDRFLG
ncbi:class I SAM-dependent methyltransferase, partial [Pseudomonas fluorescens]|nr:class I SAM-dependent methyltransferase [Pseudomonas fluorescens]